MSDPQGTFVWFELVTRDVKAAQAFYGEVLGWKVTPAPMGGTTYEMITAGDRTIGGYVAARPGEASAWTSYLEVADVDAAAARARAAGGRIVTPAFDIPTVGRAARVTDPTGAGLWLFHGAGDGALAPPGPGRFAWNELVTTDPARAVGFYQAVIGYARRDMDLGRFGSYHVLADGETPRAGVVKGEGPAGWLPYVQVDACDPTAARAQRLGATLVAPPYDVPGVGRCATFADPTGATLAIIQPAPR